MNKIVVTLLGFFTLLILVNGGTPETTMEGPKKQSTNFYGKLETHEGQKYNVENISVDHMIKSIAYFEMPIKSTKDHQLTKNPATSFVKIKVDLNEVHAIKVPEPDTPWVYKKKNGRQEIEYYEIVFVLNDQKHTESRGLIEARKKVYCDKIAGAGADELPEELDVPLAAVKELIIEGWKAREDNRKPARNNPPAAPAVGTRPAA